MSHIPITILAYLFNAFSVTIDKFLLTAKIPQPLSYIFYISLASLLSLLLLPLTHIPPSSALILASLSTILWTTGAYLMFSALKIGQTTRVIPIIGSLTPVFLFLHSMLTGNITGSQGQAILILILGMIVLTLPSWKGKVIFREFSLEFLAALFFAVSYLILRQAYLQTDFLTVFVWSRLILIPLLVGLVLIPITRRLIFLAQSKSVNLLPEHHRHTTGILFIIGQICGGISELLLTYSISLATPALVNSLQGTQYVFLLLLTFFLAKKYPTIFKDRGTTWSVILKITGIIFIALGLYDLAF